jgi:hypothetical protein
VGLWKFLLYLGSASGLGTLFTFSAEGVFRLSGEELGAPKTEVRRNVVVKRCWNFMVMETRLRSSLSSHNYRYINAGCAEIDLKVKLSSSKVEIRVVQEDFVHGGCSPLKRKIVACWCQSSVCQVISQEYEYGALGKREGDWLDMHLAVREDNSRLGIVMGEGIE